MRPSSSARRIASSGCSKPQPLVPSPLVGTDVGAMMRGLNPSAYIRTAFPLATSAMAPLRAAAERAGRGDFTPLWAGQSAPACRPMPAAELTRELALGWRG